MATQRFTNLTPERIAELSQRDDCVVYQPTHDVLFDPWPSQRVRACVRRIVKTSRRSASAEEARASLDVDAEVAEFKDKYQLMYTRLTQPEIARNEAHVETFLAMVDLRARVERGEMSESHAQQAASEEAMTRLLAQARAK